jgi:hypothetical protein
VSLLVALVLVSEVQVWQLVELMLPLAALVLALPLVVLALALLRAVLELVSLLLAPAQTLLPVLLTRW